MEPEPIQFSVGLLARCAKHLVGILSHRCAARRWPLLGQFDHALRSRSRLQPAALHAIERVRERFERPTVQLALLRGHIVRDPL